MEQDIQTSGGPGPRDVFMYLLSTAGLYAILLSLGAIIFRLIDITLPDPAIQAFINESALRFPIAVLIVIFPVYVWMMHRLQNEAMHDPAKRNMKTRKWTFYLTLALAGVVVVIDLISLILRFLEGDLTGRFILKVVAVLLLGAGTFFYYQWNLRKDIPISRDAKGRFVLWGLIVLVIATIVAGLIVVGSPSQERERRIDSERVNDLSNIQFNLIEYWNDKGMLPENLIDIEDEVLGIMIPVDPETGDRYRYEKTGELSFRLCATFGTASSELSVAPRYYPGEQNWEHEEGETCFDRTIDPDRINTKPFLQ